MGRRAIRPLAEPASGNAMTTASLFTIGLLGTAFAAMAVAVVSDIRRRIIPDETVGVVAVAGVATRFLQLDVLAVGTSLAAALVLMLALGQLSRFRVFGAGDAKLVAAASLLQPIAAIPSLLLYVALAGLPVALGCIAWNLLPRASAAKIRTVPYGLAILLGALVLNLAEVLR